MIPARLALAALCLVLACNPQAERTSDRPGEWLEFGGTWTATGMRHTLELGTERRASVFDLRGSLQLTGEKRPAVGFKAEAIGMSDTSSGLQGRAAWTDERNYLTQGELYRLGILTTAFCFVVFLVLGTPWLLLVAR